MSPERTVDISRLLNLSSPWARIVLGVYLFSNVAFVVSTADILVRPWASYAALALVTVGGIVVTRPQPEPFSSPLTNLTLGIVLTSTVLVCVALPDSGTLGRATWHLGANTWLLWLLILRRRIIRAWMGGAAMLAVTMAWAELSGRGFLAGLALATPQVLILVIATLFGAALRRSTVRINALAQRSVEAAAAAAGVEAARRIQDQRADELAETAVPVLLAIASGAPMTEVLHRDIVQVEAQLRDSVRGRGLATPAVVEAAARARDRGVTVTLLDDRGATLSGPQALAVMGAVEEALDNAAGGTVTARLLPEGRGEVATIVSLGEDDEPQWVAVDGSGRA